MSTSSTYHTEKLQQAQANLAHAHRLEIRVVLDQTFDLLTRKGGDYNSLVTMPEHMVFGDKSWVTLLWIKVHRLASVIMSETPKFESIDDTIRDLIAYGVSYLAWRNLKHYESVRNSASATITDGPVQISAHAVDTRATGEAEARTTPFSASVRNY